jgi:hypothetical protein
MSAGGWVFSVRRTLIILRLIVAAIVWIASKRPDRDAGSDSSKASGREILDRRVTSAVTRDDHLDQLRASSMPHRRRAATNHRPASIGALQAVP